MTGEAADAVQKGYLRYRKKAGKAVTAVQLMLDGAAFEYQKWGGTQRCKKGDWLLDNDGDVYTVDAETFAITYQEVGPGRYEKSATVWAKEADKKDSIETKEGITHYNAGDFLVYNDGALRDGYAVTAEKFNELYERIE
jgi:hypothetical protein